MLAALVLAVGAGSAPQAAASDCDNLFGQRCRIDLSTGVHMSYFELGSPAGETLILLHTDTTSAVEWAWTAAALLSKNSDLHIYALDQRGAGATDLPNTARCWSKPNLCITEENLAADIVAFMNAKKIAKATLVGHAMGAGAARVAALEHPDRIVRLVLSGTGVPHSVSAAPQPPAGAQFHGMDALGWRPMLEAKGVKWPQGALHMRPLDIDPDAVRNIVRNWDISVVAAPEVVQTIAAQTAGESLATWGTLDPTPRPRGSRVRLETLTVPTLVLWGSEDSGLSRASQDELIGVLRQASKAHRGMYFYWKQYGVRPPPPTGDKHDADDIGHNLSWEAPRAFAADIDSFVRTGAPTRDLYRTDAPANIRKIIVEPGRAIVVSSRAP
ncbi:MAG TPA: alpha/beta hydrolase [Steroidobacteraceae bacterium]|jgi:pimeloyl-ACP methyl ester carboxylesterase|nr:alpha/beta hydrolase [Steroidobacteraceae bacterium]